MGGEMKTASEIKSAPAEEVAKVLAEYNKARRSEPPYCYGPGLLPYSMKELGLYIDRAVELLKQKREQKWSLTNSTFPNGNGLTGGQK